MRLAFFLGCNFYSEMSFLIPVHLLNPIVYSYPWKTSTFCIENFMNIYKYMYACHKIMPVICVSDKNVGVFFATDHIRACIPHVQYSPQLQRRSSFFFHLLGQQYILEII